MQQEHLQDDARARDSNRRAWRIVGGRGGLRTVYAAAVSRNGVESLRHAAAGMATARMKGLDYDRALRARGRVEAFVSRLEQMSAQGVKASDLGWSSELGTALDGILPARVSGGRALAAGAPPRWSAGCSGSCPPAAA